MSRESSKRKSVRAAGAKQQALARQHAVREKQRRRQRRLVLTVGVLVIGIGAAGGIAQIDGTSGDDADEREVEGTADPSAAATTAEADTAAPAPSTAPAPTSEPATTEAATTVAATEPVDPLARFDEPVGFGDTGPQVQALQLRLLALGFAPGEVDGQFGAETQSAVWAFEKLVMDVPITHVTGMVSDDMWQAILELGSIEPRRSFADGQTTANHTEVYLPEQVVAFFVDDRAVLITHMSSGTGQEWSDDVTIDAGELGNETGTSPIVRGLAGIGVTPGGVYTYDRIIDGVRNTQLGGLSDPAFFNGSIAIHGSLITPLEPASRGAVRIPLAAAEVVHDYIGVGDEVLVFDGFKEPESYGEQPPTVGLDPASPLNTTALPPTTLPATTVRPTTVAPAPTTTA